MGVLQLRGVGVRYGSTTVIDDLDWSVGAADRPVAALLGPSGCGKSTLLRAIAGLEPLAAGTVSWEGEDLSRTPVHHRDFGVVFQDGQLFSGRTVAQNIAYGLRLRKWPRAQIAQRVAEMLELVQLPGIGDRRVTGLSGGQAQRVALARALAPRPRLLLLDEPLAALDARLREELAFAIGDIVRAAATPTVVVTHDRAEAAMLADEVSVMHDGAIVQTAPPAELWRRPADEWVADFLGATLMVDAEVVSGELRTPLGPVSPALWSTGGSSGRSGGGSHWWSSSGWRSGGGSSGRSSSGSSQRSRGSSHWWSSRGDEGAPYRDHRDHRDQRDHPDLHDGPVRLALRPESVIAEPVAPDARHDSAAHGTEVHGVVTHAAVLPAGRRLRVRTPHLGEEVDAVAAGDVGVGTTVRLRLDPARVAVIGR